MTGLRSLFRLAGVLSITVVLSCGSETSDRPPAETAADSLEAPGSIAGSSVGSSREEAALVDLVEEIRSGIAPLAGTVKEDPDTARQTAVRLYVTRQEVIEARWGPRSEEGAAPLAREVIEAETRFHELMETLSSTPPPDSTAVAAAVEALDRQLVEVLRAADRGGIE